jgi:spore germination protein GerM
VPASQPPAYAALAALIAGPDGDERADDFQYPLDRRTAIRDVRVDDGVAILDLGPEVDRVRGRPYSELVYWSLVYTLTEVPGIDRITLRREGAPLAELGDPPFSVPTAAGRGDAPGWARPRKEPRSTLPPL